MYKAPQKEPQMRMFGTSLDYMLSGQHPLYKLANLINWDLFETEFSKHYSQDTGRPCKPIRMMSGLLILKHLRNLSDENVVLQFSENAYYQYFCGCEDFTPDFPCNATELVHFRKRIGEKGISLILQESIRVNKESTKPRDNDDDKPHFIDSTVQEKNVTYPTDTKLHKKIISNCKKLSVELGFVLRQSYTRVLKDHYRNQRFRNHPKNKKKAIKADKKIRTIAGRLVRELERNLSKLGNTDYNELLELYKKILEQKRGSKNKIYSIHEPDVLCISKGKEHKKYEFGNKVSIIRSFNGLIVGALSFRNEYDGHTIDEALKQVKKLTGKTIKTLAGDRGYRGKKMSGETEIIIPASPNKKDSYFQKKKKHNLFCKRAGIEPTIGHLKSDYRLGRNFYKGLFGDNINVMLAAAAYNFKRMMNILLVQILKLKNNLIKFILQENFIRLNYSNNPF